MTPSAEKQLIDGAQQLGVHLTAGQVDSLAQLLAELTRWNRRINLTAIQGETDMVSKHLLDSLSLVTLVATGGNVLDIGSGAGFPAIPLAVVLPHMHVESVDSVAKKIGFQRQMVRLLGLTNLQPHHGRAEELASKRPAAFDWVVARACADLITLATLAKPFLKVGGSLVAMKGGEGEREGALAATALTALGFGPLNCQLLTLPASDDRRSLLVLTRLR